MYKITFGKDRYHQYPDMITWCETNIGQGGYKNYTLDRLPDDHKWCIDQVFGNTTFTFEDARDYSKFVVKWEWANG